MIDITSLHINYRVASTGKMKVKKVKPSDPTNELAIKHDIALAVRDIADKAEYYYVVVEIARADGSKAYRTVVPKVVL